MATKARHLKTAMQLWVVDNRVRMKETARALAEAMAREAQIDPDNVNEAGFEVGRLGTYDPGIGGAAMVASAGRVIG